VVFLWYLIWMCIGESLLITHQIKLYGDYGN
jgi:hypothetical protein